MQPKPPPGPPNREFKTGLFGGAVETKNSIQRRHDYDTFMNGYMLGQDAARVAAREAIAALKEAIKQDGEPVAWYREAYPDQPTTNRATMEAWRETGFVVIDCYTAAPSIPAGWQQYMRHKQHCATLDYLDERNSECTCGLDSLLSAATSE